MASMILSDEQATEEGQEVSAPVEAYKPRYAVSEMYLDENAMAALGLAQPLPAGTVVRFSGTASVTSSSVRTEGDGEVCMSMSLQPTDLNVAGPGKDSRAMFPKSKMEA